MMIIKKYKIILIALLSSVGVLLSGALNAQVYTDDITVKIKIKKVFKMDIEPNNNPVNLTLEQPTEAGDPVETATDNSRWINYSCCIPAGGSARKITAKITSGSVPSSLSLTLAASAYSGTGGGTHGSPTGTIMLSNTNQDLITGIQGAYTGTGINNGHQLTYELSVADYSQLDYDQSTTIQVTFTITN